VYYISPQVWAWRKYRIKKIKKYVDRMLVLFPFERDFYEGQGVDVSFVGHPLLDSLLPRSSYRSQREVMSAPRIAILPGSRASEIKYHAPLLRRLMEKIINVYPAAVFKIPVASTLPRRTITEEFSNLAEGGLEEHIIVPGSTPQVLEWADIAVVASGTATLETALIGTPLCLFYRMSRSSWWVYKFLMSYRGFIGMPNLLHKRQVAKEFFQNDAKPEKIFEECVKLIEDEKYRKDLVRDLLLCRDFLGQTGASERTAREIDRVIHQRMTGYSLVPSPLPS
jgi:lipid-A-disaccharide synthase